MSFTMRTSDVSSLRSLMHAARDLVQEIRICFSEEGLQISEQACQDNLFMFAMFRAEKFEYFRATGKGQVCFRPKFMCDFLTNRQQRDVLEWSFGTAPPGVKTTSKHQRPDRMLMRILQDGEELSVWEVWVPLVQRSTEIYESPTTDVDYILLFDTAQISNIISGFREFDRDFLENWLRITCTPHDVLFQMEGGTAVGRMRWKLLTMRPDSSGSNSLSGSGSSSSSSAESESSDKGNGNDSGSYTDAISNEYRLAHLQNIVKCFSINRGSVFMYVKRDFPLVFEVKVGTLGELRLALMFRLDQDDSDLYAAAAQAQTTGAADTGMADTGMAAEVF